MTYQFSLSPVAKPDKVDIFGKVWVFPAAVLESRTALRTNKTDTEVLLHSPADKYKAKCHLHA
jgi:hypothetical protein